MILEEFSAWFVWIIPLIASLFVPVIGKYSEKARNYFVVAISGCSRGFGAFFVPSVWSGNGAATQFHGIVTWIPGTINAGVYIDPLKRIIHMSCCILRVNHRHLLNRLHERRRRLNTILLPHCYSSSAP